jgi:hypothetical protein
MPVNSISQLDRVTEPGKIKTLVEREHERTGGVFRLAPTWVGRPGIIIPGRRIKLRDDYLSQDVAVNERWLASVTYADNGVYNRVCPPDHGLSYLVIGESRAQLKEALEVCGELLLGKGRVWDVLPKFFDNWHRIPNHLHPCDEHCTPGLLGKPESYYFPEELNMNRTAFPASPFGVDPTFSDTQILSYLRQYFKGDNRLTDLGNTINLLPGTGWFMPPCTLHAPGSLVTYELQAATDVTCIPESRVNDMVMPPDLIDRDIPVKVGKEGMEAVCRYILSMIRCRNSGNTDNFRKEYFRPPARIRGSDEGSQSYVIYRTGRASSPESPDLYSSKKTVVTPTRSLELEERAAFGAVVLSGHGSVGVPGREPLPIESASMFPTRDSPGGDEFFVAVGAARQVRLACASIEELHIYQHFASASNPETRRLKVPEYQTFA